MIICTELQLNIAHMKKHYSWAQALGGKGGVGGGAEGCRPVIYLLFSVFLEATS